MMQTECQVQGGEVAFPPHLILFLHLRTQAFVDDLLKFLLLLVDLPQPTHRENLGLESAESGWAVWIGAVLDITRRPTSSARSCVARR